jgi:hypothetical protein
MAVQSTIALVVKEKSAADSWLCRNATLGKALNAGPTRTLKKGSANLRVGGFAYVPNKVDPWTVILDVDDKAVRLWDFKEDTDGNLERLGFIRSFVTPFESAGPMAAS